VRASPHPTSTSRPRVASVSRPPNASRSRTRGRRQAALAAGMSRSWCRIYAPPVDRRARRARAAVAARARLSTLA
jgi:hypothetical protein